MNIAMRFRSSGDIPRHCRREFRGEISRGRLVGNFNLFRHFVYFVDRISSERQQTIHESTPNNRRPKEPQSASVIT